MGRAAFFSKGRLIVQQRMGAYCQISQLDCPKHPELVGSFVDEAGSDDASSCMPRAKFYKELCGNEFAQASFYSLNMLVETEVVGRACQISLKRCPARPLLRGVFIDEKGSTTPASCESQLNSYLTECDTTTEFASFDFLSPSVD